MDIHAFLADPAGLALKAMLVIAGIDFVFGVYASAKDGTFAMDALAAFLRKHILGRVFPIGTLLIIGYYTQDTFMVTSGAAAGAAYVAETAASVYGSINPPSTSAEVEATNPAEMVNPVPRD